jgi:hypothetical protein
MSEWLGRALQKLLQRFESAFDLNKKTTICGLFYLYERTRKNQHRMA